MARTSHKMIIEPRCNSYVVWHEFDSGDHKGQGEDLQFARTLDIAYARAKEYMAEICKHDRNYEYCPMGNKLGKKTERSCKEGEMVDWSIEVR